MKSNYIYVTVAAVVVGVFATWAACPFVAAQILPDWEKRGQLGDVFGAANALFSGFALAGLGVTIYLQAREIHASATLISRQSEIMLLTGRLTALPEMIRQTRANLNKVAPQYVDRKLSIVEIRDELKDLQQMDGANRRQRNQQCETYLSKLLELEEELSLVYSQIRGLDS